MFLLLNLGMAFVELLYGVWTNRFVTFQLSIFPSYITHLLYGKARLLQQSIDLSTITRASFAVLKMISQFVNIKHNTPS